MSVVLIVLPFLLIYMYYYYDRHKRRLSSKVLATDCESCPPEPLIDVEMSTSSRGVPKEGIKKGDDRQQVAAVLAPSMSVTTNNNSNKYSRVSFSGSIEGRPRGGEEEEEREEELQ
jgi:hypothetical protein